MMIIDIPTKNDFYTMADHMVNEAWEKIVDLAYDFKDIDFLCELNKNSDTRIDENISNSEKYWTFHRPKLITALTLILQSVEFRLKGLIVEISPFLLITNATRSPPKPDSEGNISYAEFHTLDAQDLIKVLDTFSNNKLPVQFTEWFRNVRILRNRFMHTVDNSTGIDPELILHSIVFAHKHLNPDAHHWIWHRYLYKAEHLSGGINYIDESEEEFSGPVWAMLQTHYEFSSALSVFSKHTARESFNFIKYDTDEEQAQKSYYCKKCISVMEKGFNFDDKHLDYTVETVQFNRKRQLYICTFCLDEQKEVPRGLWDDEDEQF